MLEKTTDMLSHKERTVLSWIDRAERRVKREDKYPNKGMGEMRSMISSSKCEYLIGQTEVQDAHIASQMQGIRLECWS